MHNKNLVVEHMGLEFHPSFEAYRRVCSTSAMVIGGLIIQFRLAWSARCCTVVICRHSTGTCRRSGCCFSRETILQAVIETILQAVRLGMMAIPLTTATAMMVATSRRRQGLHQAALEGHRTATARLPMRRPDLAAVLLLTHLAHMLPRVLASINARMVRAQTMALEVEHRSVV